VLNESMVGADPIAHFHKWMAEAIASDVNEPTAMHLATCGSDGQPTLRVVLLKEFSPAGFTFFTNYESRKGSNLHERPVACLNFFWPELQRQVRIEGTTEMVPEAESDAYFASRPRESRIGAWASPQSRILPNREALDELLKMVEARFPGEEVPRPPHWGGYLLRPHLIEFWQGRPSRLHDRILFSLEDGKWVVSRLAP
jgi:pyridoxamine 5'-phosphate oxidase